MLGSSSSRPIFGMTVFRHHSNRPAQNPSVHRTASISTLRNLTCGLADVSVNPRPAPQTGPPPRQTTNNRT